MKLLLASLAFCSFAHAAEKLPTDMYCDDTKTIVNSLLKDHKEAPFMLGNASDMAGSTMTFWINPETKTWSITATKDNTTCIVGVGENLQFISYDKKSKPITYY